MSLSIRFSLFACLALCPLLVPQLAGAFAPTRHDGRTGDTEFGKASWYGYENGHHTASGERYDKDALTAAHRHLPFDTIVRVTNRENGRSVEVRINDRGPWCGGGRIIDVSSAAADVLRMKKAGIVRVEIEVVRLGSPARLPLAQASAP